MTDATLNRYVASGTTAERTAFTPSPATPASGPDPGYLWWDTDLQEEFAWDAGGAAWVSTAGGAGSGNVSGPGAVTAGNVAGFFDTTGEVLSDLGVSIDNDGTLTADSDGFLPTQKAVKTYVDANASGDFVLLEQHTAADVATLDFTTCITATYDTYIFELVGLIPVTDNVDFWLRFSTDGGSTYDTSATYDCGAYVTGSGGVAGNIGQNSQGQVRLATGADNASTSSLDGTVKLYSPLSASLYKRGTHLLASLNNDTNFYCFHGGFRYRSTTAADAVRFMFSSGNVSVGTIRAYGVAK